VLDTQLIIQRFDLDDYIIASVMLYLGGCHAVLRCAMLCCDVSRCACRAAPAPLNLDDCIHGVCHAVLRARIVVGQGKRWGAWFKNWCPALGERTRAPQLLLPSHCYLFWPPATPADILNLFLYVVRALAAAQNK